jgi:hypothetical protein
MPTQTEQLADVIALSIHEAVEPLRRKNRELEQKNRGLEQKNRELDICLSALTTRMADVEQRPVLEDKGVWKANETYAAGAIVSHHGSGFICSRPHVSRGIDLDHTAFRLLVKRGRDARDR